MKPFRVVAILLIIAFTASGWWLLSGVVHYRTHHVAKSLTTDVSSVWGPELSQKHPVAWCSATADADSREVLEPSSAGIEVKLHSDPKKRGLLWHRTYGVDFKATYTFTNPASEPRVLQVKMELPSKQVSLRDFHFQLGDQQTGAGTMQAMPRDGVMQAQIELPPGGSAPLSVTYTCRGTNSWRYEFPPGSRIQNFLLAMHTDFTDISYPVGTGSPTAPEQIDDGHGCRMTWDFKDMIAAQGIGMDMPSPLNAGPIASNVAAWAPLSLVLFFGVILLVSIMRGIDLHPMHYLFVAAGLFVFPLLFAYSVDVADVYASFFLAAGVSLLLVCGYLRAVGGGVLFRTALAAHLAYVVLFGYSFFHRGATGLVLIVIGIVTLGGLMMITSRVNWSEKLRSISPKLA